MENRRELAECLRRRLVTWMEGVEARALSTPVYEWFREMAVDASDEELITAHLICEDCGEQLITLKEVDAILRELRPNSADQFLDLVYHFGRHSPQSSHRANKLLSLLEEMTTDSARYKEIKKHSRSGTRQSQRHDGQACA